MKIVITSGYFNPITLGHLDLFNRARELGDHLIVIVNNDNQVKIKGSKPFMSEDDRMIITKALKPVSITWLSIDQDGSVCKTIQEIHAKVSLLLECFDNGNKHEFIFAKGGDRFANNVPEVEVCNRLGIKIVDGLGAKIRSSSDIMKAIGDDVKTVLNATT